MIKMNKKGVAWTVVGLIVFVLVFVIIVTIFYNTNTEETLRDTIQENDIPIWEDDFGSERCEDDDGGKNYFTKGIVRNNTDFMEYSDECKPPIIGGIMKLLQEYFCVQYIEDGPVFIEKVVYSCPNKCENGACVV